jgi:hypothetical protein
MPTVSLAPSIRKALQRIAAKDSSRFDQVFGKHMMSYSNQEIMLAASTHLCEGSGKFWDSESKSEDEHLGEAETLSKCVTQSGIRLEEANLTSTTTLPVAVLDSPSSPKRIQASWKRLWKGPLPPRRIMPVMTIGDFILPALSTSQSCQASCVRFFELQVNWCPTWIGQQLGRDQRTSWAQPGETSPSARAGPGGTSPTVRACHEGGET